VFFDDIKEGSALLGLSRHFPRELEPVSRYCLFAHQMADLDESGLARGIPTSDFIVALGPFIEEEDENGDPKPRPLRASSTFQAGTFMHELGHVLGLRHGGGDETNHKPNYLSVMNYSFQKGMRKDGGIAFDFSREALPELNERDLDEPLGIGNWPAGATGYATTWFRGFGALAQQGWTEPYVPGTPTPVNWNLIGDDDEAGFATSINLDFSRTALVGFNDWANLNFEGGTVGAGLSPPPLPEETPTGELDVETAQLIRPAPVQGLAARSGRGTVRLNWSPGGLRGDVTYRVFRKLQGAADFAENGTTTSTLFSDRGVTRRRTYVYVVTMIDGLGVESLESAAVVITVR